MDEIRRQELAHEIQLFNSVKYHLLTRRRKILDSIVSAVPVEGSGGIHVVSVDTPTEQIIFRLTAPTLIYFEQLCKRVAELYRGCSNAEKHLLMRHWAGEVALPDELLERYIQLRQDDPTLEELKVGYK